VWLKNYYIEITAILVFVAFFYLLTSGEIVEIANWIPKFPITNNVQLQNLSTIFLSIFIEGLPFILMGVFVSSFIHEFVNEELIWKWIPRNPLLSIPMAACLGIFLPICECGIVPVARRLIQKGLPAYTAFTFLLAAPIVNPVTIVSTYIAFRDNWDMVLLRLGLGAGIAITMGILFLLCFNKKDVLKRNSQKAESHHSCNHDHSHQHHSHDCHNHSHDCHGHHTEQSFEARLGHALYHSIFEFIDMGKYFVAGALIAACFQTFIGMSAIKLVASHEGISILVMMVLAFGLSICSSSDAFVAASFRNVLGNAPLFSFLVYGPMMDLKNLLMMTGSFRSSVIWFFWGGTTILTILSIILFV